MMDESAAWQTYVNWLTERGLTQPRWRDGLSPVAEEPASALDVLFVSDIAISPADEAVVTKLATALKLDAESWQLATCIPDPAILQGGIPDACALDQLGSEFWSAVTPSTRIVTFGPLATRVLCGRGSFSAMRGQRHTANDRVVMPTYHPRDFAKRPELKRDVWTDMQALFTESPS